MDVPWSRTALNRLHPSMDWTVWNLRKTQGENWRLYFNPHTRTNCLMALTIPSASLPKLAKDRKSLPHFPLIVSIKPGKVEKKAVESANLVASLPGNDLQLKNNMCFVGAH